MNADINEMRNCKIVATVGPSSNSPDKLALLARTGVNVFRINFSHGEREEHAKVIAAIREMEEMLGTRVAVLADMQGPKIRVGKLADDELELVWGAEHELVCGKTAPDNPKAIPIPHPEIFAVSAPGDQLLFDDGRLAVEITEISETAGKAKVVVPGTLKNRKGVNVPDKRLPISAITEKDKLDMQTALDAGADFIALSFVQHANDVKEALEIIGDRARIVSKIEKPTALDHLEGILELSHGVMVARGDLGVEMPPEQVPVHQRRIVRMARKYGRPVIVATQMLESMIDSPVPTRAEASDVATAVYQGADAVMLSAESAVGRHPQTVVALMSRIIREIESAPDYYEAMAQFETEPEENTADAICHAATAIAENLQAAAIVAFTMTGSTGKRMSRARPKAPILLLTEKIETARRGSLYWGVSTKLLPAISTYEGMMATAKDVAKAAGVPEGQRIVITAGFPFGRPGKTNLVQVTRID